MDSPPDDHGPARTGLIGLPAERAFLLVAPLLSYWLMNFKPVMQNGFLDPYIYTAFIHNFTDLFDRYGTTYYGVRFGTILPGQIATTLFGPIGGYFVVRYTMALLAGMPFYYLARQRYGRATAVAVLLLLLTSPFLARTLLWDYPDSTGVPYLFAAICFYLIEHPRRRLLDALSGLAAGLAVHSNVFTLAPIGLFLGVHAAHSVAWRVPVPVVLRRLFIIAGAIVAVSALGAAYYWWRTGHADIFSITLTMSATLAGGGLAGWRTEGFDWVASQWSVLIPVVVTVLAALTWVRKRLDFEEAVIWTSGAVVTLFYYVYQFLLNGTFLQLFYYFSYLIPFVFLQVMLVTAAILQPVKGRKRPRLVAVLCLFAVGPWLLFSFEMTGLLPKSLVSYLWIVTIASVLVVAGARMSSGAVVPLLAAASLGLILTTSAAGYTMYRSSVNSRLHPSHVEIDVYQVALQFMKVVPPLSENPGEVRFWYSNQPPSNAMQSIQSTYLWGYSKLQGEEQGLPFLGTSELEAIREPSLKWLGLLAEQEEQLAEGRATLLRNDIPHSIVARRVLKHGTYTLYVELLDLQRGQ